MFRAGRCSALLKPNWISIRLEQVRKRSQRLS
jgi:hypothetical protein